MNKQPSTSSLIRKIAVLEGELQDFISHHYYNSQPLISIKNVEYNTNLDFPIADILLIGALTQSSVLLSGSSGSGKTYLAELMLEFLFSKDGYARKNITPDMNEQDFLDIDFGAIKEGKTLKAAISADQLFDKAGLIIDEANRAPAIIQNRLMQILENNIDLKSKKIKAGIQIQENIYYHWNILTLNYGDEYAGTSDVDRALKDRITIDIPIDSFPPMLEDQIQMIRKPLSFSDSSSLESRWTTVSDVFQSINSINITLEAEALILYMSLTSNCIKSPTGSKYGVTFSPQFCKGKDCMYARNPPLNSICPFTFAPSNRVIRRVVHLAKGFTLLKQAKLYGFIYSTISPEAAEKYLESVEKIEVTVQDIISIVPIVIHSKLSMNKEWVFSNFNGSTYLASVHYIKVIGDRLNYFMNNLLIDLVSEKRGKKITEKAKGMREKALKDDFHYEGLIKYVNKYLV